jgi:hypothetical protein
MNMWNYRFEHLVFCEDLEDSVAYVPHRSDDQGERTIFDGGRYMNCMDVESLFQRTPIYIASECQYATQLYRLYHVVCVKYRCVIDSNAHANTQLSRSLLSAFVASSGVKTQQESLASERCIENKASVLRCMQGKRKARCDVAKLL